MRLTVDPVAIIPCPEYDPGRVETAMREAISLTGDTVSLIGNGNRVLIKPNLLSDHVPEDAVTTHPAVVRAAIRLVKDAGGIPVVGDSPALKGRSESRYRRTCETSGILQVIEGEGAELAWFDKGGVEVSCDGRYQHRFTLAEAVLDADVVFNLPKLKTHGLTILTGAVKNLFGCIPGLKKASYHLTCGQNSEYFAETLLDLAILVRPAINVMDAIVAMEGSGPSNGKPKPVGYLLASQSPWALDWAMALLVGLDPMKLSVLRVAKSRGLLEEPLTELPVAPVKDFTFSSKPGRDFPPWLRTLLKNQLVARPKMIHDRCNLCGNCREICPPEAIARIDGHMSIDYNTCIRCYCCQEVCKQDAVQLYKNWLARQLDARNKKRA